MFGQNRKQVFSMVFALTMLGAAMTMAARQERTAEKQAAAPAAAAVKPGAAEMERLKFYLGEWDYTESYPKSPFAPNGGKNAGLYTSKLGPGGQSLVNSFHSKAYVFGNGIPGAIVETGQFEGDALVYRFEFPVEGGSVKLRNVTRVTGPGTLVSEEYSAMKDAPETLLVHVEAKKR
jgi:hypothetical protein